MVGPKPAGKASENWSVSVAQALVRKSEEWRDAPKYQRAIHAGPSFQKTGVTTMKKQLTAIIEREGDGYVSLCPELDIASQGDTIEEARDNLREALGLFFESASQEEIQTRLHDELYVTRVEVVIG